MHWLDRVVREWASFDHGLPPALVDGLCECFDCARLVQAARLVAGPRPPPTRPLSGPSGRSFFGIFGEAGAGPGFPPQPAEPRVVEAYAVLRLLEAAQQGLRTPGHPFPLAGGPHESPRGLFGPGEPEE